MVFPESPVYVPAALFICLRLPLHKLSGIFRDSPAYGKFSGSISKMIQYVHVVGRQHGVTPNTTDDRIGRLEETIKLALPEGSKWHGMFYHQGRKRVHPSWFRKQLILAFAGHKGLKDLDRIWYQTWIFVVNLEIEGDFREGPMRTILGLDMTLERMECTDGSGLDAVTRSMLQLRNEIPWLQDRQARRGDSEGCVYFGKWFEIGRHI